MANYREKGVERMRELGCAGGAKSAETRRLNALRLQLIDWAVLRQTARCTDEEVAAALAPVDMRGGSHDDDWRCPVCRSFNSIKSRACAKCNTVSPENGRIMRARLRELAAEHRTTAILAKHGL